MHPHVYAKRGLADTDIVCDFWATIVVMSQQRLAPVGSGRSSKRSGCPALTHLSRLLTECHDRFERAREDIDQLAETGELESAQEVRF